MAMNRRIFLKKVAYCGLGAGTFSQVFQTFSVTNALAQPAPLPYKAIVVLFFNGGNDANNMVVPIGGGTYIPGNPPTTGNGGWAHYNARRGTQGLALPEPGSGAVNALLPINVDTTGAVFAGGSMSSSWAMHPSFGNTNFGTSDPNFRGIVNLFNQGKCAVVCNVGPLLRPWIANAQTAKQQYNATQKVTQLFSHSDQVNLFMGGCTPTNVLNTTGWCGRTADRVDPMSGLIPQVTSIAGNALITVGAQTRPLNLGTNTTQNLNSVLLLNGFGNASTDMARRTAFDNLRGIDLNNCIIRANSDVMNQAVLASQQLNVNPTLATAFPTDGLGNQLLQVARVMKANYQNINPMLTRQMFFVNIGGYDTHSDELTGQGGAVNGTTLNRGLLGRVNDAVSAFFGAMRELNGISPGHSSRVVLITLSDFNRTYNPAGSGPTVGTDHGWGSFHLVVGDGVQGQRFYGTRFPGGSSTNTVLPLYQENGAYDAQSRGLWVSTTSIEQFGWTLASWYGLGTANIDHVFPLLNRWAPADQNLGFIT